MENWAPMKRNLQPYSKYYIDGLCSPFPKELKDIYFGNCTLYSKLQAAVHGLPCLSQTWKENDWKISSKEIWEEGLERCIGVSTKHKQLAELFIPGYSLTECSLKRGSAKPSRQ
jgi:hypothetical protein